MQGSFTKRPTSKKTAAFRLLFYIIWSIKLFFNGLNGLFRSVFQIKRYQIHTLFQVS